MALGKTDETCKYFDKTDCSYVRAAKLNVQVKLSQSCTEKLMPNTTADSFLAHAKNYYLVAIIT